MVRSLVYHYCRRSPVKLGKTKIISATRRLVTPHESEASLIGGGSILADLSDLVPRLLYFLGYYEYGLTNLIRRTLQPGHTFIDIGAHVGYYTVMAGTLVGAGGSVHSFEPIPEIYSRLQENVALNRLNNVRANEAAICDKDGDLEIFLPKAGNTGTGSIVRQPNSSETSIRCPAMTLDSYVRREAIERIRLIKLDIEGGELCALHGMKGLLSSPQPPDVICEAVPVLLERAGTTCEEILRFMDQLGYRARIITDKRLVDPGDRTSPKSDVGWNLYFTRNPL